MTTYYVRKTGSDAAAGTSAGAAWLTIDKAANTVAAGDTVYIGSGVYRELVTMDTSGTSGSVISYIADLDGSQTGDGGSVIISAYDSNSAAAVRAYCLNFNAKTFIEWHGVVFNGSASTADSAVHSQPAGAATYEGVVFDNCVMIGGKVGNSTAFFMNGATTPATAGLTFNKCYFYGRSYISVTENAAAQQNMKASYNNCVFSGCTRSDSVSFAGFYLNSIAGTHGVGGITLANCTFASLQYGIYAATAKSTTYPVAAQNSTFIGIGTTPIVGNGSFTSAVSYTNCRFAGAIVASSSATDGGGNDTSCDIMIIGGIADLPLYNTFGWSPYKPYEPMTVGGVSLNDCIDNGNATYAPSDDLYGNARPMGTADDVGAVESNPRGARSATWAADGSTYSMAFTAIGYYESMIPVDATSTTVTVVAYKDASYTGTAPKLEVLIGDTSQGTDSMVVAVEVEETLSVNFTPSAAGWARVRIYSYATAGTVFFDSLAVA